MPRTPQARPTDPAGLPGVIPQSDLKSIRQRQAQTGGRRGAVTKSANGIHSALTGWCLDNHEGVSESEAREIVKLVLIEASDNCTNIGGCLGVECDNIKNRINQKVKEWKKEGRLKAFSKPRRVKRVCEKGPDVMKRKNGQVDPGSVWQDFTDASTAELGTRLEAARLRADLSLIEVALRMKKDPREVRRLEQGKGNPTWKTLQMYLQAVGTRVGMGPAPRES